MTKRTVRVNENHKIIGEDHPNAKLTDAEVELIRKLHEGGMCYREIAEKFDIGKTTVADIVKCRRRAQTVAGFLPVRVRRR